MILSTTFALQAQQLYSLKTSDLNLVHYGTLSSYVVPHVARCFENALDFDRKLFNYEPKGTIAILLEDFEDYASGAAGVTPNNIVKIGMSPINQVYETLPANERFNWIMNHELVHVVTLDKASAIDRFYRTIFFGKVSPIADNPLSMIYGYLTAPRTYSTRWYREGLAVFVETWMAGGLGRALGSYDEMVFRTMVRDSSYFYDPIGLESEGTRVDFQVGANAYLYGTRFITYMAARSGPEKVLQWITRTDDSNAHYASQFEHVYGISLSQAWDQWIAFEHDWQQKNLDSLRKTRITPYRLLTQQAVGSVSRVFYDPSLKSLIAAVNYPGQVPHIARIDINTGTVTKVCDVKGGAIYDVASVAYDPATQTVFFTINNNSWRTIMSVDLNTGSSTELMKDVRIGDLVFDKNDRSLWGVRHDNGYSTLVRIPYPYSEWNTIHTFPFGKDVFDLDVAPDRSVVSMVLSDERGRQKLIQMKVPKQGEQSRSIEDLYDFETSVPAGFVFSTDGKSMFGTSYYSGVSNIYRLDLGKKDVDIVSNCETGFFRPIPYTTDSLIVFRYTGKGFAPAVIRMEKPDHVGAIRFLGNEVVDRFPIVKNWKAGSPARINLDSLTESSGTYSGLGSIRIASVYPVAEGYKSFGAYGFRFNMTDPLFLHSVDATVSYTPNQILPEAERIHAAFHYKAWEIGLRATWNGADFYDLFGPTKVSRKGYSVGLNHKGTILYNDPEMMHYAFDLATYGGLERLPDFQNVSSSYDRMDVLTGRLEYSYLRKSLGATDFEKGIRWDIASRNSRVNGTLYPLLNTDLDYGIPLPLGHSSIWLRSSAGASLGNRNDPSGNFYFGGFGNNWIDHLDSKRFRENYSFPGAAINDIGGSNYGKLMVEWMPPPIRFRSFGFSLFYCSFLQLSFFSGALVTNVDDDASRRTPFDAGAQADFRLVLFNSLDATFSLGYARAFEQSQWRSDEFMISLKIL
jgi:hypothetical protein